MSNPPIDIWPILAQLGIAITESGGTWSYTFTPKRGVALSGSGYETADEALREVLHLIIGYAGR